MQTVVVLYPRCVRVTVPGVPNVTVEPLVVEGVPPLVAILSDMYGFAHKKLATERSPFTVKFLLAVVDPTTTLSLMDS